MTYAIATLLDAGLVFTSDTRTNAGVDHVSTFKKMTVLSVPGDRVIVLMGSGNLSITQAVINQIMTWDESTKTPKGKANRAIKRAPTMYEAARIVGAALRDIEAEDGPHLQAHGSDFNAMFILGGQIKGEAPRLFLIYSAGNFIEASNDTRYFQIGEMKYGKPIVDRIINAQTSLDDALKCVLISFDSTMRSNVSVSMPLDTLVYERDSFKVEHHHRVPRNDPYMTTLSDRWSQGLLDAFNTLPTPELSDDVPLAPSTSAVTPRRGRKAAAKTS